MRITGSHTISAPRDQVWEALQDPAVLSRTLPGCEELEVTGPDAYAATVTAGVASIKGTYAGRVQLSEKQEPTACRLLAEGAGTPGTISADVQLTLDDTGEGTVVTYDADAIVGGMIGGVGQRMLTGVAKRTAGEFFSAVERALLEGPEAVTPPAVAAPPSAEEVAAGEPPVGAAGERATPQVGQVFRRPPAPAPAGRAGTDALVAAAVGAAIALAGVAVGFSLGRRRRPAEDRRAPLA